MTISSSSFTKLAMLSSSNLAQQQAKGAVAAEEELAIRAFQQMYEMMLQGDSGNSSMDMSSIFLPQFASQLTNNDTASMEDSLSILGNYNASSRLPIKDIANGQFDTNRIYGGADLGHLSAKYESNGNPGVIANNPGDYGGKSYGAWQFSSRMGSLNSFINSLQGKNDIYYNKLVQAKAADGGSYGTNFDNAWRTVAKEDRDGFLDLQQSYVKEAFYDKAADTLNSKYNFDINSKSTALKNVLWSTVVQHGVNGALGIFSKVDLSAGDEGVISQVFDERQKVNLHFRSSSAEIRKSVYNRFGRERSEALAMLRTENI
jgi:hypothetical protein